MAEPLILAYGRGELPEFPASPDSVIDIVPCDHVVNAIVAVCATEPKPGEPAYYHVSSGRPEPADLQRHVRPHPELLHRAPAGEHGQAGQAAAGVAVSRVRPRSSGCSPPLSAPTRLADRVITRAPRSDRTRKLARDLDRFRGRLTFIRRYLSLYNEYAQSELHFVDDNTLALTAFAGPARPADAFAFDTAVFDWKTYIEEVHCPRSPPRSAGWTRCATSGAAGRPR